MRKKQINSNLSLVSKDINLAPNNAISSGFSATSVFKKGSKVKSNDRQYMHS